MSKPYGLMADIHCHNWQQFSTITPTGINSRLGIIISEIYRCAEEVRKAGGNKIVFAGDVFHVRGSIAPTVLNPVKDCIDDLINDGFEAIIEPGNHDLESKDSTRIGSAVTSLESMGVTVIHTPQVIGNLVLVPWYDKTTDLLAAIQEIVDKEAIWMKDGIANYDLIIHAPIDNVIEGLPSHGLTDATLAEFGFKRVFAGHYHNYKDFGNGVYSIGPIAHHTWSDVGSKAGFLIVHEDKVERFPSRAPEFIDITEDLSEEDIILSVEGNYARVKLEVAKPSEVEESRKFLLKHGAKGVVINVVKKPARERVGATVKSGERIENSIATFIDKMDAGVVAKADIIKGALDVLARAGA